MAASDTPVGLDHHTAVPENFDPESETCESCGEPLAKREAGSDDA